MPKQWNLSDFEADEGSLYNNEEEELEGQENEEENEEEGSEEEKPKPSKKPLAKKPAKVEEEEEEEEEEKPKKKVKAQLKSTKPPVDETEEQEEEEEEKEPKEEEEEADEVTPDKFFEEVEKITGREVEVDYKDVDPLSPQGVAIREQAIRKDALDAFVDEIEAKYPDAFKALQHSFAGGNVSDLFSRTTARDYSKVELKDEDTGLAKEILKEFYRSKGIKSETKIEKLIEIEEDSEAGLVGSAKDALQELKAEQEEERNTILDAQKKAAEDQSKKDRLMLTAIDEVLETRKLGDFRIADRAEASEFRKFIMSSVQRASDGKYVLNTPLDTANLEKVLQYHYFQYKKGDLSKVIQKAAATENTKKLSLRLKADQSKKKQSTTEENKNKFSMRDFNI